MISQFQRGIAIGLAVSVPVGPIALLVMRRSVRDGRLAGFISGLGAATADLLCGTVAAFGLAALTMLVQHHTPLLQIIGGLVLIAMGVHVVRSSPPLDSKQPIHERRLIRAYFTTCALTLANPMTFVGMMFVSAAAGVGSGELSTLATIVLGTGIFLGSAVWWLTLSFSSGWLGRKLGAKTLHVVNLIAGAVIVVFGVYQLVDAATSWLRHSP
ncbi:lysine transporter LysE [Opitutaceae bacterium EW11]|nr:lysine transporter LysE [Opitutaceae bacterium EW11]